MSEIAKVLKEKNLIIACSNDAGGAEVLSSFIKNYEIKAKFLVGGPATIIYENKFSDFKNNRIIVFPSNADLLVSSTGWSSDLEFDTIAKAISYGTRVIAVLDHWSAYESRFERHQKKLKIDEIIVFDHKAKELAERQFPAAKIYLENNPYLTSIVIAYKKSKLIPELNISKYDFLYLCEPRNIKLLKNSDKQYSDFESLEYFFKVLAELSLYTKNILLRPHPSEEIDKYRDYIPSEFLNVTIDRITDLPVALLQSSHVVGCNTMAMVAALACGKKVYSSVPPPYISDLDDEKIKPIIELRNEV